MKDKGSWSGGLRGKAYYPSTPDKEAAKRLRLTADRFVNDRATKAELTEACNDWLASVRDDGTDANG